MFCERPTTLDEPIAGNLVPVRVLGGDGCDHAVLAKLGRAGRGGKSVALFTATLG